MTDIPKVITTLTPVRLNSDDGTSNSRTYSKSPESDKLLYANTSGFVETSLPHIRGGFLLINNSNTLDGTQRNSQYASALTGDYFNTADVVLDPCAIGPQITYLICNVPGVNRLWTFPSISALCAYLKSAFPDLYRPGLYWEFTIINNTDAHTLTVRINDAVAPQVQRKWGLHNTINKVLAANSSVRIGVLIEGTQLGSEKISFFIRS